MVVVVVAMIDNGDVDCEYGDGELDSSGYCHIFQSCPPSLPNTTGAIVIHRMGHCVSNQGC